MMLGSNCFPVATAAMAAEMTTTKCKVIFDTTFKLFAQLWATTPMKPKKTFLTGSSRAFELVPKGRRTGEEPPSSAGQTFRSGLAGSSVLPFPTGDAAKNLSELPPS